MTARSSSSYSSEISFTLEQARDRAESLIYNEFVSHVDEQRLQLTPQLSEKLASALTDLITETPYYEKIVAEFSRRESDIDMKQATTLAKHIAVLSVTKALRSFE